MAKTQLLARPHFFIVAEMKPFLEHSGYLVVNLKNLAAVYACNSAGVVISLEVTSSLGESAAEVSFDCCGEALEFRLSSQPMACAGRLIQRHLR